MVVKGADWCKLAAALKLVCLTAVVAAQRAYHYHQGECGLNWHFGTMCVLEG